MKIFVTGGTGTVGKEVVKALLRRGASVRVLTRNKEAKLPDGQAIVDEKISRGLDSPRLAKEGASLPAPAPR
jgi:nucleoside-diphosphate-sugar epimerase